MRMEGGGKDKKGIRRPMNAFLIFCKRHRGAVRQKNPELDNRSITRLLGDLWAKLGEEKNTYINIAKQFKDAFLKENPNYRWHGSDKLANTSSKPVTKSVNHWTMKNISDLSQEGCITPGKLADPDKMGGLNLLLMADRETSHNGGQSSSSRKAPASTVSHIQSTQNIEQGNSALLQLADMCSSELNNSAESFTATTSSVATTVAPSSMAVSPAGARATQSYQPIPLKKRARHWSLTEIDNHCNSTDHPLSRAAETDPSSNLLPLNLSVHSERLKSLPQLENYSDVEQYKRGPQRRRLSSSATESIPSPLPSYMDGAESPVFSEPAHPERPDYLFSEIKFCQSNALNCGEEVPGNHQSHESAKPEPGWHSLVTSFACINPEQTSCNSIPLVTSIKLENSGLPAVTSIKLESPNYCNWRQYTPCGKNNGVTTGVMDGRLTIKTESQSWAPQMKPLIHTASSSSSVLMNFSEMAQNHEKLRQDSRPGVLANGATESGLKTFSFNNASTEVKLKKKWVERMLNEDIHQQQYHAQHADLPLQHSVSAYAEVKNENGSNFCSASTLQDFSAPSSQKQNSVKSLLSTPSLNATFHLAQAPICSSASSHPKLMMQLSQNQASHSYQPGQIWNQRYLPEAKGREQPNLNKEKPHGCVVLTNSRDEMQQQMEQILNPVNYNQIAPKQNIKEFDPLKHSQLVYPSVNVLSHKTESASIREDCKSDVWAWQENYKPMTASSLVEKVVREVCGSPPRKDSCITCRKSELTTLTVKTGTSQPAVTTNTSVINQPVSSSDILVNEKSNISKSVSATVPSPDSDVGQKASSPAECADQSDHDDTGFPQVRKSRRPNRGQKYQALIKEGFIQPSRERLAARNAERSGRSFGTREEFEKMVCKKILKRSASEREPVLIDTVNIKLNIQSTTSSTSASNGEEKRFKTGGFDLEKEIESLPMCSLDQMEKKKSSRRKFDGDCHSPEIKSPEAKPPVNSDLYLQPSTQQKTTDTPAMVNFQDSGCPALHIPIPKEKRPSEPVIGCRKRKTRNYCITRISVEGQMNLKASIGDSKRSNNADVNKTSKTEVLSELDVMHHYRFEDQNLAKAMASVALLNLSTAESERFCSDLNQGMSENNQQTSPHCNKMNLVKSTCPAPSKMSKKFSDSSSHNPALAKQGKTKCGQVSRKCNGKLANLDSKLVDRHSEPCRPTNNGSIKPKISLNKRKKNLSNASFNPLSGQPAHKEMKTDLSRLVSNDGLMVNLLSTLVYTNAPGEGQNSINNASSLSLSQVNTKFDKKLIPVSKDPTSPSVCSQTTAFSNGRAQTPCQGVTAETTATIVTALPSQLTVVPQVVSSHLGDPDRCPMPGPDLDGRAFRVVSSSSCFSLSTPATGNISVPASSLFTVSPSVISLPGPPSDSVKDIVSYSVIGSGSMVETSSPHIIGSPHVPESPSVAVVQS